MTKVFQYRAQTLNTLNRLIDASERATSPVPSSPPGPRTASSEDVEASRRRTLDVLRNLEGAPPGLAEVARASLAITGVVILGIAVFALMIGGRNLDPSAAGVISALLGGLL